MADDNDDTPVEDANEFESTEPDTDAESSADLGPERNAERGAGEDAAEGAVDDAGVEDTSATDEVSDEGGEDAAIAAGTSDASIDDVVLEGDDAADDDAQRVGDDAAQDSESDTSEEVVAESEQADAAAAAESSDDGSDVANSDDTDADVNASEAADAAVEAAVEMNEDEIRKELGIGSGKIEIDTSAVERLLAQAVVGYEQIFAGTVLEAGTTEVPRGELGAIAGGGDIVTQNLSLLRDVNMRVKVELGRGRMYLKDLLRLAQGSVVELERLAGDPLDIYVNEKVIARGEVLVLNENFCIRITEIYNPAEVLARGA